ncbi:hypothetical protein [Phytohalomonas tamaricis]|uniref:hypothetical protein n=1 Tax=Phytohalomonas tamaricis TaxID=2081032 RepID=UPI001319D3BE|nr:hypothetical protein [Phytohalomonas tamaricis]
MNNRATVALSFEPVNYSSFSFERVTPTQLPGFRLPEGEYGLVYSSNSKSPDSHYFIETNLDLSSVNRLMGSDYIQLTTPVMVFPSC